MPLNVQTLIDELDPAERKKVDELTEQLRAEYAAYHNRPSTHSGGPDSPSSTPLAASPSKQQ